MADSEEMPMMADYEGVPMMITTVHLRLLPFKFILFDNSMANLLWWGELDMFCSQIVTQSDVTKFTTSNNSVVY